MNEFLDEEKEKIIRRFLKRCWNGRNNQLIFYTLRHRHLAFHCFLYSKMHCGILFHTKPHIYTA